MNSNFQTEGVQNITTNVIHCFKFCVANKELWKTDKINIIRKMKDRFPEFYEKFPRIVHMVGNCDDSTHMTNMLKMLHEVEHGKLSLDNAHVEFNSYNNNAYGRDIIEDCKQKADAEKNQVC